jgi:hypothetical protein
MATIELKPEEALVFIEFLLRFRDDERLTIDHVAEQRVLWDLCPMLESDVPELLSPDYSKTLAVARDLVASDDWE